MARALITGAASGIGRALAYELARRGTSLALADIDREGVEAAARATGAESFVVDLRDPLAIERLAREAGEIDLLINNAGVAVVAPLLATKDDDWSWILDINLHAPIRLTRALLPQMIARGRGHIVFTASLAGLVGAPGMLAYSTTKFAVVGFAEALRLEVASAGIDVSVVCPGYVKTNLHRATRYENDGFKEFLDDPPSWYGIEKERAAELIADGIARKDPLIVLGIEKLGWWLKRLSPAASFAVTKWIGRRANLLRRDAVQARVR